MNRLPSPLRRCVGTAALCGTALLQSAWAAPSSVASALPAPLVRTAQGPVVGAPARLPGIAVFKGLPYAAAPVGALRWAPPGPAPRWRAPRQATAFGASCPQPPAKFDPAEAAPTPPRVDEDCLTLNIWTPKGSAPRRGQALPVLVWIHGGAFTFGSGSLPAYDGSRLAQEGLVVVTINYRVGQLGYLSHPALRSEAGSSGNYALQDQVAALRWVQQHIGAFGGDARQVTIAGHSGGSISVGGLLVAPAARGLFARAIAQSGPLTGLAPLVLNRDEAEALGSAFASRRGADDAAALRALSLAQVTTRQDGDLLSGPVIDGVHLPEHPALTFQRGSEARVPLMIGVASSESGTFVPSPATPASFERFVRAFMPSHAEAVLARYPHADDAQAQASQALVKTEQMLANAQYYASCHARHGAPTYLYLHDHAPPGPDRAWQGAYHGSELPYVFGNLQALERPWTEADRAYAAQLMQRWVHFIRSGTPNPPGQAAWPRHQPGAAPYRLAEPGDPVTAWDPARLGLYQGDLPASIQGQGCAE